MITSVSVIIPTYNRSQYIVDSINSVLAQRGRYKCEIIVVDDGSTDSTKKVLDHLKKHIIYKKIPNSGRPAVPRNHGLRLARHDIVAFQDSDDLWVPDKLQVQIPIMENSATILSYGNAKIMTSRGHKTSKAVVSDGVSESGYVFNGLLKTNFVSNMTVVARREVLMSVGGFDEQYNLRGVEDYELWLRLSRIGKFAYIDKPLAYYRRHEANVSHTIPFELNEHILAVYKSILKQSLSSSERIKVHQEKTHLLELNSARLNGANAWLNRTHILYEKALMNVLGRI